MIIDNKNISDKDIERINSWSRNKLTRDDIYAFEIALCSDKIDVDYEMISEDCLYRLQRLAIGSTGILSQKHNARIYDTYFTVLTNPIFDSSQNGEDYNLNKPITKLIAKAFIRKDHIKREELESILSNAQGSIGFGVQKKTCSICGETDCFRHIKGKYYKTESGEKLCYLILDSPTDFYEWSICPQREENENDNEQPKGDKQMGVKAQLNINGELTDVEIEDGIKVGDEVCNKKDKNCKLWVTRIYCKYCILNDTAEYKEHLFFDAISNNGMVFDDCKLSLYTKTGRHNQKLLESLKE